MIDAIIPDAFPEQAQDQTEIAVPREPLESDQSMRHTTIKAQNDVHHVATYPVWPTSQPGPQTTLPLPGQHPHPLRTDQMVSEFYDQARGRPGIPPLYSAVQEHRGKAYLPDDNIVPETQAP